MKIIFCHEKDFSKYKLPFFNKKKNLIKKIPKTLFISGGSRNGNHLVWSLLDGNKNLPTLAGEDKFLSSLFKIDFNSIKVKKSFEINKINFAKKLSGGSYDKWKKIHSENLKKANWAGLKFTKKAPLIEFPEFQAKVFYKEYTNTLKENLKSSVFCFYDLYIAYLKGLNKLSNKKNYKTYRFINTESGLRKEILFLLKNGANIKCVIPIRKFESFYFSKCQNMFNSTKLKKNYLKEIWSQWKNKTLDYLYLKKKYPNNIILVFFEDIENLNKREFYIKKILKKLRLKFNKINLIPTSFRKKVFPNSSFKKKIKSFKKNQKFEEFRFPKKNIPRNYRKIYNEVKKLVY